jgi:hypothetical protein
MNKIFNRLIYVCVVFLMLIPLVSCSGGGSSGTTGGTTGTLSAGGSSGTTGGTTGTLSAGGSSGTTGGTTGTLVLGLTDAPAPEYKNVFVTIKEVRVKHEEKTDWDILTYPDLDLPQTFDLLELRDGVIADLGLAELEAGHYNQMRLILDTIPTGTHPHANYLYIQGDEVPIPLRVLPSELKNGIKIVGGFTIVASGATEVTLDFDAQKSVVRSNGKKDWHLKPTIKVLETLNNLVFGTVDPAGAYVSGQIFDFNGDFVAPIYDSNGDPIESIMVVNGTFSDDNGDYIIYLPPNTYNIVAFMESYVPECQVVVAEPGYFDWPADDFTLAAADPTGTLTGTVEGLTTAESALFSIRQENTDCGGMIEVTSFPVLEWTTSALITLPAETTYQVVVSAQGEETYVEFINLQADENEDVVYPPSP